MNERYHIIYEQTNTFKGEVLNHTVTDKLVYASYKAARKDFDEFENFYRLQRVVDNATLEFGEDSIVYVTKVGGIEIRTEIIIQKI